VGIVSDTAPSPGDRRGIVYLSIDQHTDARLAIVVRTSGDPSASVDVIRRTIVATDAEAPILDAGTGVGLTGAMSLIPKIAGGIAGALGGLALVLSMAGLYGLMSALVIGRTREIGVRLALGAEPHRIVRLIARQGLAPVMSGLVAGLVLGALVRMSMRPFFTRLIPELDWVVLALVPIPFMIAALVACYLPARRAARIDPNVALRDS
jgi:ABC-type antimicrobial peptide transport system permease subunit